MPAPGEADEPDLLAGPNRQRQIIDDRLAGLVGEADIFETDFAALDHEVRRIRPVGDSGRCRHNRHGILDRADRLEDLLAHLQEGEDVAGQPLEDIDGADKFADRQKPSTRPEKPIDSMDQPVQHVEDDDRQLRAVR